MNYSGTDKASVYPDHSAVQARIWKNSLLFPLDSHLPQTSVLMPSIESQRLPNKAADMGGGGGERPGAPQY